MGTWIAQGGDDDARIELVNQHGKTLARSTRIYASLEEAKVDAAKRNQKARRKR